MKLARLSAGGRPEIFESIQGEGPSAGTPSVFVRTSLCNLHCRWCDTAYTWNWEGTPFRHDEGLKFRKEEQLIEVTAAETAAHVMGFTPRNVVLTGGEPLLQQTELAALMTLLRSADVHYSFEIETNGTLVPHSAFDGTVTRYNVSPKLSNAGMRSALRLKHQALQFFSESEKAFFKFVVRGEGDLREVLDFQARFGADGRRIFLMPEGTDSGAIRTRLPALRDLASRHGFRVSDRLHIHACGNTRGS